MSQKTEFTGVFIPEHIWYSKELTPDEKYILVEMLLVNYSKSDPKSILKHLADAMQRTKESLTALLLNLETLGYVVIDEQREKICLTELIMPKI